MKHARADYDRIQDPAGLIPNNEPVFLLRGQDISAPHAVLAWCESAKALGVDLAMIKAAEEQAFKMVAWQNAHGQHVADAPKGAIE